MARNRNRDIGIDRQQNEMKRDEYYAEQKNDRMKQAMEENAARKKANEAEAAAAAAGADDGEAEESKAGDAETLFEAVESQADHASLKDGFEAFKGGSGEA